MKFIHIFWLLAATARISVLAMPAPTPPEDQFHGKVHHYSFEVAKIGPGGIGKRTLLKSVTKNSQDQVVEEFLLTSWPPEVWGDALESLGELTFLNPNSIGRPMLMTEHHHFARDKNGRVSEDVCQSIKEGEKFTERRENTYDSKGHLIGTKCYRDGKLGERDVYTYDEHGLLSGERYVGDPERLISSYQSPRTSDSDVAGAPRTREEVEKDESGNAIRRRTYDTDEVLIADAYFRYNEKNIVMQSTIFHSTATGISPFKETSTTDPKSNSETIETVDRAGDILSRIVNTKSTYTIDNREYGYGGKLVKRSVEVMKPEERFTEHTETDADGKVTNYGKNWMEDGKMHTLESGNLMDGKFMTRRIDYLDLDMDLPLEIEESDASGKCLIHIRLAYDMDERGNWTKITRYDAKGDGKLEPVAVAFRTIEYAR